MIEEAQRFETENEAKTALNIEGFLQKPKKTEWQYISRDGLIDAKIREIRPFMNAKREHYYRVHFRA